MNVRRVPSMRRKKRVRESIWFDRLLVCSRRKSREKS
jgi:hypothetical protein